MSPFGVSISWLGLGGDAPFLDGTEPQPASQENGDKKAERGDFANFCHLMREYEDVYKLFEVIFIV